MHRESANTDKWAVAEKQARNIEAKHEAALTGAKVTPDAVTLEDAVSLYLVSKYGQQLASSTLKKLETTFEKQMLAWFHDAKIFHLGEVDLPALIMWRSSWADGARAMQKKQERVVGFFWFCFRNKWLTENPALGLSRIKVPPKEVEVLTDSELAAIIMCTHIFGKIEWQRARLRAMVQLMRWSGLAIRDAVTLERDRLTDDDRLLLYRTKTKTPVHVPLPPVVAEALRKVPPGPKPNPKYFFWSGHGNAKSAVANWQRALSRLFELADIKNPDGTAKRVHPHMLRHTFATMMLSNGVPIESVAMMLGHSSIKTTEKYYSHWNKARADRLDAEVRAAWA
jgi:integrase